MREIGVRMSSSVDKDGTITEAITRQLDPAGQETKSLSAEDAVLLELPVSINSSSSRRQLHGTSFTMTSDGPEASASQFSSLLPRRGGRRSSVMNSLQNPVSRKLLCIRELVKGEMSLEFPVWPKIP